MSRASSAAARFSFRTFDRSNCREQQTPFADNTSGSLQGTAAANQVAYDRLTQAEPVLIDIKPALEVNPGMTAETILTSGAPMPWGGYYRGQRNAIRPALCETLEYWSGWQPSAWGHYHVSPMGIAHASATGRGRVHALEVSAPAALEEWLCRAGTPVEFKTGTTVDFDPLRKCGH